MAASTCFQLNPDSVGERGFRSPSSPHSTLISGHRAGGRRQQRSVQDTIATSFGRRGHGAAANSLLANPTREFATCQLDGLRTAPISLRDLPISKRELLGLVLARICRGPGWKVGYDPHQGQPNDGYITDETERLLVESKLIPQYSDDVLASILATYEKVSAYSDSYGAQRVLFLLANAGDGTMVKISDLHDAIGDTSPFDRVIQAGAVSIKDDGTVVVHLYQPYPTATDENTGSGLTQVDFNLRTGDASVLHRGIDWT